MYLCLILNTQVSSVNRQQHWTDKGYLIDFV